MGYKVSLGNCPKCCGSSSSGSSHGVDCVGFKVGKVPRRFRLKFLDFAYPGNPDACEACNDLPGTEVILNPCYEINPGYCSWTGFIPLCPNGEDAGVLISLQCLITSGGNLQAHLDWWNYATGPNCGDSFGDHDANYIIYGPTIPPGVEQGSPEFNNLMFDTHDLDQTLEPFWLTDVCWFYNPFSFEFGRFQLEAIP